jgi:hypothetical protein
MVYTLNFVAPAGYFTARGASLTVCGNPSTATATARLEGVVRVAGGAFAPEDRVTVTLSSGGRVEADVADARTGHIYRLTAPFGISSFARIVMH